jgi:hypothetical protein
MDSRSYQIEILLGQTLIEGQVGNDSIIHIWVNLDLLAALPTE